MVLAALPSSARARQVRRWRLLRAKRRRFARLFAAMRAWSAGVGRHAPPSRLAGAPQRVHGEIVAVGSTAGQIEEGLVRRSLTAAGGQEGGDEVF